MNNRIGGLRSMPDTWEERGECKKVSPSVMYPGADTAEQRRAKAVCLRCPVRDLCLEHALRVNELWGTWGGLGEAPRRRLRSYRRRYPSATLHEATKALGLGWSPPRTQAS